MKKGKIHLLFCFLDRPETRGVYSHWRVWPCIISWDMINALRYTTHTHTHREIAFTHNNTQTFSNSSGTNNAPMLYL